MDFMKRLFRYDKLWVGIAWFGVALVIYLSLMKTPPTIEVAHGDKVGHFAAYAVLTFWFMQLYEGVRTRLIVVASMLALGVVIEVLQYYTGYRSMEAADAAADALGIAIGWLASPPRTLNVLEKIEKVV
jgi:VanZ family protein